VLSLTAFSDIGDSEARVFTGVGRADGERAFRAAVRHSRFVRFLRVAVPCAVLLAVAGAIGVGMLLSPLRALSKLPIDLGSVVVAGTKIMMQQPRIAGYTRDNRRYDLTAQAAGQDLTKPDMVELQGIHATMEMQDNALFETTAQSGLYNSKTEMLTLSNNIVVSSNNGYKALLSEAALDIRAGKIVSEKPVHVDTGTMSINANRLEVTDGGDVMRFERGVTVLLQAETAAQVSSAEGRKR
jgi:lipopolysaccharide export system protein LptC